MPSVTTAVPSGLLNDYCIASWSSDNTTYPWTNEICQNSTKYNSPAYETICCDGNLIDTTQDIWAYPRPKNQSNSINLRDLVCCHVHGKQPGGLQPINPVQTACTVGIPTPLASLAATNTDNAQNYLATFVSASYNDQLSSWGDWTVRTTPTCLWANTSNVPLATVSVPAAQITTLPPASTDALGNPIYSSTSSFPTTQQVLETSASSSPSSTSTSAANPVRCKINKTGLPLFLYSIILGHFITGHR